MIIVFQQLIHVLNRCAAAAGNALSSAAVDDAVLVTLDIHPLKVPGAAPTEYDGRRWAVYLADAGEGRVVHASDRRPGAVDP